MRFTHKLSKDDLVVHEEFVAGLRFRWGRIYKVPDTDMKIALSTDGADSNNDMIYGELLDSDFNIIADLMGDVSGGLLGEFTFYLRDGTEIEMVLTE